jgi:regulator of replication initiation timing
MSKFRGLLPKFQINMQQQILPSEVVHHLALTKIEQLEVDVQQKDRALSRHINENIILRDKLQDSMELLQKITIRLNRVESDLNNSYMHIQSHIECLVQENRTLQLSNDAWSERSIKLEFEVLAAREEIKAMTIAHNLALDTIVLLERDRNKK